MRVTGSFNNQGRLIYDMNDFDQVMIGSYCVDLWRTASSMTIHALGNGMSRKEVKEILRIFANQYFVTVLGYVGNDNELYYQLTLDNTWGPVHDLLVKQTNTVTRDMMLDKYCPVNKSGKRQFDLTREDLLAPNPAAEKEVGGFALLFLAQHGFFRITKSS